MNDWVVYLIECSDGSYYCGATNNLEKRLGAHSIGKGAKYVRSRCPIVCLVAFRDALTKGGALSLEYAVKQQRSKQAKVKKLLEG